MLANYRPDQVAAISQWHLRDFLLAFENYLREEQRREYRHQALLHMIVAPYSKQARPPKIPPLLRRRKGEHRTPPPTSSPPTE